MVNDNNIATRSMADGKYREALLREHSLGILEVYVTLVIYPAQTTG